MSTDNKRRSRRTLKIREVEDALSSEAISELRQLQVRQYIARFVQTGAKGAMEVFALIGQGQVVPVSVITLRLPLDAREIAEILAYALDKLAKDGHLLGSAEDLTLPFQDVQAPESNTGPTDL